MTVTLTAAPAAVAVNTAEFARVVRAGRGRLSQREQQDLLSQNHPLLGQLAHPPTKKIIELFANLPDSVHKHLLKQGYLKWKFTSLDAARQKVYRDILKSNLDMVKKQGMKPLASMSLDALKKGDVGFAVIDIPELKTKVVSWYILLPKHPQPIWVTVVGVKAAGKQPYFAAHRSQLAALRSKRYSKAPTLPSVRNDALLLMNFEKKTFYQKEGKTYVRDLSGRGNDGLCDGVKFSPKGKVGGGLANGGGGYLRLAKTLIAKQSDFTIAAWVRLDKIPALGAQFYSVKPKRAPTSKAGSFHIICQPGAHIYSAAYNEANSGGASRSGAETRSG